MTTRRPPRLAVWLLNRFGLLERNEAFAGDLAEEFRSGRTAGWFWRQTLVAVLIGTWRNIRRPEVQAVCMAWAIQTAITVGVLQIYGPVHAHFDLKSTLLLLLLASPIFAPFVPGKFMPSGYWWKVLLDGCAMLSSNGMMIMVFDFSTSMILLINLSWLLQDIRRTLRQQATRSSVG